MFQKRRFFLVLSLVAFAVSPVFGDELEENWNDFLHYTAIGRYDLSEAYAQKILDSDPDPVALLKLSQSNPTGYQILLKMQSHSEELRVVSTKILKIIDDGRLMLRIDPRIIKAEISRLSTTIRGRIAAEGRLKNAGEYAISFMLEALADKSRSDEFVNISAALAKVGRDAIRPLVAALEVDDLEVKLAVVRALGEIGYGQPLAYLKYIEENDSSGQARSVATVAIGKIDKGAGQLPSAELFFQLGEAYYYHNESLAPSTGEFSNIWFWDVAGQKLVRKEVNTGHFHELMAMRSCEWALRSDASIGKAIALWIASFFKSEAAVDDQPVYFGSGHADAMTYATTAGAEYLHTALERALVEKNQAVALGVVEALAANAGEKSLLYRLGTEQPLVQALGFSDISVKYSAAIAIAVAQPNNDFVGSDLIIKNLSEAVKRSGASELGEELSDMYAVRAVDAVGDLALSRNAVVDVYKAIPALVEATKMSWGLIQAKSGHVLAMLESPEAQRAVSQMALAEGNSLEVRKEAFSALAVSAKRNGNLLTPGEVDRIYAIVGSKQVDAGLRGEAASAYGALNLPSKKVKDLILDQASK